MPKWKIPIGFIIEIASSIIVEADTASDAVDKLMEDDALFPKDPKVKVIAPEGAKVSRFRNNQGWAMAGRVGDVRRVKE